MGCGEALGRILISMINLLFLLASGLLLAFGITAKVSPADIGKVFDYILPAASRSDLQSAGVDISGIIVSNAVFMIVIGAVGIVIAGIGFTGACCLVKWFLFTYAALMIILVLGEIALIVFAALYTESFKNLIQKGMYDSLTTQFREDIHVNMNNGSLVLPTGAVDIAWASMQIKEQCCGAYNYSDYGAFQWKNTDSGILMPNESAVVPISCCRTNSSAADFPPHQDSLIDIAACLHGTQSLINDKNCYDAVIADIQLFIKQYKVIAIGIAAGIAGLELILIVISCVLFCKAVKDNKPV